MKIRIWNGNAIVGDLDISRDGSSTTWVSRPSMPDNSIKEPDLEIDPFAMVIKPKGCEAVEIEKVSLL